MSWKALSLVLLLPVLRVVWLAETTYPMSTSRNIVRCFAKLFVPVSRAHAPCQIPSESLTVSLVVFRNASPALSQSIYWAVPAPYSYLHPVWCPEMCPVSRVQFALSLTFPCESLCVNLFNCLCLNFLENEERNGNLHGHIVRVNEAHEQSRREDSDKIPIEEQITAVNEGRPLTKRIDTSTSILTNCSLGSIFRRC